MIELTPGKLWGMRRMADAGGFFKMTAVDQRPPIIGPIAKYYRTDEAPYDDVAGFKALLIETLQAEASAMLLDPHFAVPRGLHLLSPQKGLILTLEDSHYEETADGDAWAPGVISPASPPIILANSPSTFLSHQPLFDSDQRISRATSCGSDLR